MISAWFAPDDALRAAAPESSLLPRLSLDGSQPRSHQSRRTREIPIEERQDESSGRSDVRQTIGTVIVPDFAKMSTKSSSQYANAGGVDDTGSTSSSRVSFTSSITTGESSVIIFDDGALDLEGMGSYEIVATIEGDPLLHESEKQETLCIMDTAEGEPKQRTRTSIDGSRSIRQGRQQNNSGRKSQRGRTNTQKRSKSRGIGFVVVKDTRGRERKSSSSKRVKTDTAVDYKSQHSANTKKSRAKSVADERLKFTLGRKKDEKTRIPLRRKATALAGGFNRIVNFVSKKQTPGVARTSDASPFVPSNVRRTINHQEVKHIQREESKKEFFIPATNTESKEEMMGRSQSIPSQLKTSPSPLQIYLSHTNSGSDREDPQDAAYSEDRQDLTNRSESSNSVSRAVSLQQGREPSYLSFGASYVMERRATFSSLTKPEPRMKDYSLSRNQSSGTMSTSEPSQSLTYFEQEVIDEGSYVPTIADTDTYANSLSFDGTYTFGRPTSAIEEQREEPPPRDISTQREYRMTTRSGSWSSSFDPSFASTFLSRETSTMADIEGSRLGDTSSLPRRMANLTRLEAHSDPNELQDEISLVLTNQLGSLTDSKSFASTYEDGESVESSLHYSLNGRKSDDHREESFEDPPMEEHVLIELHDAAAFLIQQCNNSVEMARALFDTDTDVHSGNVRHALLSFHDHSSHLNVDPFELFMDFLPAESGALDSPIVDDDLAPNSNVREEDDQDDTFSTILRMFKKL